MKPEAGAEGATDGHPDRFVSRLPRGGFAIGSAGRPTIRAEPCSAGWRLTGTAHGGWSLARSDSEAGGFVLKDAEGPAERGRTLRPAGCGRESGLKFLLLENGRLFRIVHRGARQGRFELLGWETPGAYLVASPEPDGWSLVPMVAAGGLEDLEPIVVLLAAEVLDAEQPLTAEEP